MSGKAWIVFGIITAAIFGGIFWSSLQNKVDMSDITAEKSMAILGGEERSGGIGDQVKGNRNAKVVVIEYGDFQCGACRQVHPQLKSSVEKYSDHVAFIYRHFPITQSHPNAFAAAAAAEAAGMQGKYWEMHDTIYEHQDEWSSASPSDRNQVFKAYATKLGLNESQFADDMAKPETVKKIKFDMELARINKVSGTPTIYINGTAVSLSSADSINKAIEDALRKQGVEIKSESPAES